MIESGSFTTSDGCNIAYSVATPTRAVNQRVVLIHSLGLDRSIWNSVVPLLANEAQILFYDCRGHGKSSRRKEVFTTEQFARDLSELLDHLGWQKAIIAGCSMGGCVAQALGGLYPNRASALALIDTTAWYGEKAVAEWRERAELVRSKGFEAMCGFQGPRWVGDSFRASHPDVMKALMDVFVANDMDCYVATCVLLGNADLRPHLASLRMPVAVIVGDEDYATPPAMARELRQSIPGSTLTILPGARHLTPVECPEKIAGEIRELMRRVA